MLPIVKYLWLIPALPLLAAGCAALLKKERRAPAAALAIGSMSLSFLLSLVAFLTTLHGEHGAFRETFNFTWFEFADKALKSAATVQLGWVLDPLTAMMLVMVTFVGLLIFIYSIGYMAHDENFTRFFCFLALFAAAMLGIVIANSLLLVFISWELVGLASYLLIGFWYHKPSAAAAAKKAFITTRVGDMGFLLGMLWLYSKTGTLLFYDGGSGCLEQAATKMLAETMVGGMALSTAISILIFCGAAGKSGQVPLHVWLPDAMEGPTPVSALIHAATMVAAGVFLMARVYPLVSASIDPAVISTGLKVMTWVGAITAVFAACIAVAQNDIKRILAYSTVSQLGYMMLGLGVGGVAVGMFHLITHAFFKALLFMGSGSVIHGCHEEQDIRKMGGLNKLMPVTFATYAVGMLALCGFPLLFSGFWSKDEILAQAHHWQVSQIPFYLGVIGAFLTAFYMTRQMCYVFFGKNLPAKSQAVTHSHAKEKHGADHSHQSHHAQSVHESPRVMTLPLVILAVFAVLLGFIGTPAWPWFHGYLAGHSPTVELSKLTEEIGLMAMSAVVVFAAMGLSWMVYSRITLQKSREVDPLEKAQPALWRLLSNKFFIDELYEATFIRLNKAFSMFSDWLDRTFWAGAVNLVSHLTIGLSWLSRKTDEDLVNGGFDHGCNGLRESSRRFSRMQSGQTQSYFRIIGIAFVAIVLVLIWRAK